jgi:hypothetical protein
MQSNSIIVLGDQAQTLDNLGEYMHTLQLIAADPDIGGRGFGMMLANAMAAINHLRSEAVNDSMMI